jgi:CheY-like chemotaxis protein
MGKKILLIEDESDQVMLLKNRFEASGYEFFYALNGFEGLKQIKEIKPDIVLLDLNMPQMNGFEVLKKIHADEELKKIPVFIITAKVEKNIEEKCRQAGAVDIVFKPYDSKELMIKIKKYI